MSATALPIGPPGRAFVRGIGLAFSFQIPSAAPSSFSPDRPTTTTQPSINTHLLRSTTYYNCVGSGHRAWLFPVVHLALAMVG